MSGDTMQTGNYHWKHSGCDQVDVQIRYLPTHKLEVAVWWNHNQPKENMLLWITLADDSVKFSDLIGNGYGTTLHRKGIGTFVVNLAIQVLQLTYEPATPIGGILSNPNEDGLPTEKRLMLEESRQIFWSRFGLKVKQADGEQFAHNSGTVGNLNAIEQGMVAGQFPRYLPLEDFTFVDD